ncbi:MAG: class I SAM-dependent methyltransferase [Candidatus Nealsonbacteria bacterium]|nr:class I SAM-dependent methyltransferase [Candidatus Nealsonbacteria bacterium]
MEEKLARELLEKTKKDYDLIIEDFSRANYNLWPELFSIFNDYTKNEDKILDVGCGIGRLLEIIGHKDIEYLGIDSSAGQLQEAKRRHPDRSFSLANATRLPSLDDSFDKVFLVSVLHHIPGKELQRRVVGEAVRVLKPGGLLFLSVWRPRFFVLVKSVLKHSFLKLIRRSKLDWLDVMIPWGRKTKRYYHLFRLKELQRLIRNSGLEIVKSGVAKSEKGRRLNLYLIARKVPIA